jgi:uncharacterized membrane protein (UPF0127 family)
MTDPTSPTGSPPLCTYPLLLVTLLGGLISLPGCTSDNPDAPSSNAPSDTTAIPFDKEGRLAVIQDRDTVVVLDLEIAETDSAQRRGMMQREGFPNETSGMLFPFDQERERNFWMANTPVALDIFFVNADSQIVNIAKYAEPVSADQIPSNGPAKYVLETPAGFADSYGILEGDRLRWERIDKSEEDRS